MATKQSGAQLVTLFGFGIAQAAPYEITVLTDELTEPGDYAVELRFAGAFLATREMMIERLSAARKSISLGELIEQKNFFKMSCASIAMPHARCRSPRKCESPGFAIVWRSTDPRICQYRQDKSLSPSCSRYRTRTA